MNAFKGLGKLPVMHKITSEYAHPDIHAERKVPEAMRSGLWQELQGLLAMEVIESVEFADWVH